MELFENERLDYVNDNLSLIQNTDGLTFGTDALLLAGYISGGYKTGVEIGGGTGIISMLLLSRKKVEEIYAVEVQEEYARLIERNAEFNSLDTLYPVHSDIREWRTDKVVDLVFTNPPYMKATSGYRNTESKKNIARHEVNGGIDEFMTSAARILKWGGDLYVVYRPDRMVDLLAAMRSAGVEPKRITLVCADSSMAPSLMLVMGKRGGKPDLVLTESLYIYNDEEHKCYTPDMQYIMDTGTFPQKYYKK